jgi:hypothetical protein
MIGKMLSELRASWLDYRECGDLGGHARALIGVLLGWVAEDSAEWHVVERPAFPPRG